MSYRVLLVFPELVKEICKGAEVMLRDKGYSVTAFYRDYALPKDQLLDEIKDADAMIVSLETIDPDVLQAAKKLKTVCKFGVGLDNINVKAATENNVVVTNIPGANAHSVADIVFGYMLALAREIEEANKLTKQKKWTVTLTNEIYEKTIGIIGLGNIGKAVAKRASGFDMKILAHTRTPDKEFGEKYGITFTSKEEVIKNSDFLSISVPLTEETKGMIGIEELNLMKESAYLINTARGGVVDEEALYKILSEGKIKGAAVDVFEDEPYYGPLLELDNIIVSAHIAGTTYEAIGRMWPAAVNNVIQILEGGVPVNVVNPEVFDKLESK